MARRLTASTAWVCSVRGVFRNLSRAGVAKNRSRTSMRVPLGCAAGSDPLIAPPSTDRIQASSDPLARLVRESLATAPIAGSASPRKPRLSIASRSSSGSFDVAWRSTARVRSSALMPWPSSDTTISVWPPSRITASMRVAPASMAFSTSSLTTEAGRSTTSPAAMRLMTVSGRRRMVTVVFPLWPCGRGQSAPGWRNHDPWKRSRLGLPARSPPPVPCSVPRPTGRTG